MTNLGIVGCGDVAFRSYLPGLSRLGGRTKVAACFDVRADRAGRAAALFADARAYTTYDELLAHPGLDAVINLTPAPLHRDTNDRALDAGLHVYSEKPIAGSVEDAQALIEKARRQDLLFLGAPGMMATGRFKWMKQIIDSGRIGQPTLGVGQLAGMGPADWKGYTGDPAVFYSSSVGPLIDTGVYLIHGITGLMGPAKRVQAFGGVSIPRRKVTIPDRYGETVEVESNDHMLLHLDMGDNRFAQILSSFAVPGSRAPALEIHCSQGSMSIPLGGWYDMNGPFDVYVRDESELGLGGWMSSMTPPASSTTGDVISTGAAHFVACLEGEERAVLTAEHACHALEIMLKAGQSAREGRALDLDTTC